MSITEGKEIRQEIEFESDDPSFAGVMRMVWSFGAEKGGTRVTVRAENVPVGIRPVDHEAGMNSTLEKLDAFRGKGA